VYTPYCMMYEMRRNERPTRGRTAPQSVTGEACARVHSIPEIEPGTEPC
jgi:hypothetical protein